LGLSCSTSRGWIAFKIYLEYSLKSCAKDMVVLGCTQEGVDHGDKGDMALDRPEVPQLILVQSFCLAFLVIDFHGPAMASDASDASGVPDQAVADIEGRVVG
jgi:hypothetical protein